MLLIFFLKQSAIIKVMNTFNHILSNQEKQIFENHFIYEVKDSKIEFIKCASQIINKYSINKIDLTQKWSEDYTQNKDYCINLIWNEETNTTILHHLLSLDKIKLSRVKVKHLRIFNNNLNPINKNGEIPLILLAKHYEAKTELLNLIKKPLGFDFNLRDNQNKNFYIHFFETYQNRFMNKISSTYKNMNFIMQINNFNKVLDYWMKNYQKEEECKNLLIVSQGLIKTSDIIKKIAKECGYSSNKILNSNIDNIEKISHMLELIVTMNVNQITKKKAKI